MTTRLQFVPEFELEPDEYGAKAYHMGYEAAREGRTSPGYLMSEGLHMWWSMGFADWLSGRPDKHKVEDVTVGQHILICALHRKREILC